ncbi:sensor histidine kinase [Sandaracinus amylolyticus]|uniref:sensor histidine kinase n=1 Tax=Sandaracinus amylolyticus TaxID=927083 RepID=UPI001F249166|nr:HAMP domain-containing sensor histidine kinase [Sandaracinus amylolyticus]UJR82717.1 Hypothetical protein I5071_47820 [Sandaracinus amylolyticus]
MDVSVLAAVLDELVLERLDDGRFVARSPAPGWCDALSREPPPLDEPFVVEEMFEFMTAFVADAEAAWEAPLGARVDSDFWTEDGVDGEQIHLEATAVRVGGARALVIRRNERLYAQQQLVLQRAREQRLAHDALTREIETKDILVHAVVHDLAAPLHSVLGTLSLLAENAEGIDTRELVGLALQAGMRQRDLIAEILDVFSAEHGGEGANVERGESAPDAAAVIQQVLAERELVARRRAVRLVMVRDPAPAKVIAEPTRLFRVVTNLLDNAIRLSPESATVEVCVTRKDDDVVITVADEGPGIAPELLPQLFEKLPRGRDRRGTGLGLYFCRITVEGWGGRIGYEPRAPRGSKFWVRLRAAAANTEVLDGQAALAR